MKIRLPADLKDRIEALSKKMGRSMNAEIVARLYESVRLPEDAIRPTEEIAVDVRTTLIHLQDQLQELLESTHKYIDN